MEKIVEKAMVAESDALLADTKKMGKYLKFGIVDKQTPRRALWREVKAGLKTYRRWTTEFADYAGGGRGIED